MSFKKNTKLSLDWSDYDGDYEKSMQDIILHNGTQVNCCWPNAGYFNPLFNVDKIPEKEVSKVRLTHSDL
jgi:hypothetical protein